MAPGSDRTERLVTLAHQAQRTLEDVAEVVWNAYGMTSKAGGLAKEAYGEARLLRDEVETQVLAAPRLGPAPAEPPKLSVSLPAGQGSPFREALFDFHEQVGEALKHLQRHVTTLCVAESVNRPKSVDNWVMASRLGKIDHLVRKLRSELDALALREQHGPNVERVAGYYYGDPLSS